MPRSPTQTVPTLLAHLWSRPQVRLVAYTLLILALLLLASRATGPLAIIALAYALAYTVNPLLRRLEGWNIRRPFGIGLLLLGLLSVVGLLFWTVATQVVSFVGSIPALLDSLPALLERLLGAGAGHSAPGVEQTQGRLTEYVRQQIEAIQGNLGPLIGQFFSPDSVIYGRVSGALNWLGQAGLVLTLAVFFMLDHGRFGQGLLRLFPREWQPRVLTLSDDLSQSFGNYIRGQLLLLVVISAISAAALLLIGVPNALALGLLTGLLNLVPLVGMVLAAIPALLQALPLGNTQLLLVLAFYIILNQVAWNVIAPMVMGRSVKISAVGIIVALLVGGGLAGLPGALLAIPTASLLQRWITRYWLTSPAYQGERLGPAPETVQPQPQATGK
ncbi:Predicted PurR-regulated permease PerM [Deinococcus reticulitermitis]|uniref:Predicted PurR-regulated permease PerM n=1 Tax=Deinococcus reticulitermitis TaxID=856736 RepID=A0A1H6WH53_9DEIO|nr:AI-2E family transporter [Deinococcus reticulitermitis]SEJ16278.1 Predicted PurR-regulated permease PerM [Deinococcus reticulitermitis]